ncbi:MAG: peptidylprolyl isomerase [Candidatus Dormibacteria bacterium]
MFHHRGGVAVVAGCAAVLAACGSGSPAQSKPSPVIARVGSSAITLAQFDIRYQSACTSIKQGGGDCSGGAAVTQVRAAILRGLILDTVIRQRATELGLAATQREVAAEVATDAQQAGGMSALEAELAGAGGSIAQLEDEIASNINEQRVEDVFAQQRAAMVEQMLAGGASFIATAKTYSDDSGTTGTASKGGDLGILTGAQLKTYNPAFAAAVESLAVGAYTRTPVHDAGGYDIVMVYSKTATGWGVRHILIYAGNPYTVTDRPGWFTEALFSAVDQLCATNAIQVSLTNAGGNPCTSPSPSPSPAGPSPQATATAKPPG